MPSPSGATTGRRRSTTWSTTCGRSTPPPRSRFPPTSRTATGRAPADAAEAIVRAAGAGAVGGSIEDYDPDDGLYGLDLAVERVAAAVEAARGLDFEFTLTARAENHIRENPDLDDTIARLRAYEEVGADVLYAPGLRTTDEISAVCKAVSKPVNVLARPKLTLAEIAAAGATRISLGGSLAWVAMAATAASATEIRDQGDFSSIAATMRVDELLGE